MSRSASASSGTSTGQVGSNDDAAKVLTNGAKLVGEAILPGASLLMDDKLGSGTAHAVLGYRARMVLGPLGLLLVAADSYSKSVTYKYLWQHVSDLVAEGVKAIPGTAALAEGKET